MTAIPAPRHGAAFFKPSGDDQASRLRALVQQVQPGPPRLAAPVQAPGRYCPLVAVASGKGGVGKTGTCVNLAIALAQRKLRATLLDADLGLANADVMCGITPTTRLDAALELRHAGAGSGSRLGPTPAPASPRRSLAHIAIPAPGGFRLVPGAVGLGRMANLSETERDILIQGLVDLEHDSDMILIDTAAGIAAGVTSFVEASDAALVVVTPEPTSIADAYALIKCVWPTLLVRGDAKLAIVINNAASRDEGEAVHARIAATCRRFLGFEPALAGVIRHDPEVLDAVRARTPVRLAAPKCPASRDLDALSVSIMKLVGVQPIEPPRRRGILSRFLGR